MGWVRLLEKNLTGILALALVCVAEPGLASSGNRQDCLARELYVVRRNLDRKELKDAALTRNSSTRSAPVPEAVSPEEAVIRNTLAELEATGGYSDLQLAAIEADLRLGPALNAGLLHDVVGKVLEREGLGKAREIDRFFEHVSAFNFNEADFERIVGSVVEQLPTTLPAPNTQNLSEVAALQKKYKLTAQQYGLLQEVLSGASTPEGKASLTRAVTGLLIQADPKFITQVKSNQSTWNRFWRWMGEFTSSPLESLKSQSKSDPSKPTAAGAAWKKTTPLDARAAEAYRKQSAADRELFEKKWKVVIEDQIKSSRSDSSDTDRIRRLWELIQAKDMVLSDTLLLEITGVLGNAQFDYILRNTDGKNDGLKSGSVEVFLQGLEKLRVFEDPSSFLKNFPRVQERYLENIKRGTFYQGLSVEAKVEFNQSLRAAKEDALRRAQTQLDLSSKP